MDTLGDILNEIGNFKMAIGESEISFPGVLRQEENDVILKCKLAHSYYNKIDSYGSCQIYGSINGTQVTFLNVYLKSASWHSKDQDMTIIFDPSEIVIGKCCTMEPQVIQISISNPEFNDLLSSSPLPPHHSLSQKSRSLLEYVDSPAIAANDKHGHLSIQKFYSGSHWSNSSINYEITTAITYKFKTPIGLSVAISNIALARALLAFFANYYLSFGAISFVDYNEDGTPQFPSNRVYLNHEDAIPTLKRPFLIAGNILEREFEAIWSKWLNICTEAQPVVDLFYEIICNRSTRINRFLNLAQAIEVYSRLYRAKEVEETARIREGTKKGKTPPIHLNHRFEDIFSMIAVPLKINKSVIPALSKSLANIRNYYTHYDEKKYIKPSYQEMLAACHILEFVLLAIVYHQLGISDDHIQDCKSRAEFQRFDEFVDMLHKDFSKSTEDLKK